MLRERNQTFKIAFVAFDFVISAMAWVCAIVLHFEFLSPEKRQAFVPDIYGFMVLPEFLSADYPLEATYALLGFIFIIIQMLIFIAGDLYHPRRGLKYAREFLALIRSVSLNLIFVLALLFFYRGASFSRAVILYFAILSVLFHSVGHYIFRKFLERMRARGFNVRRVLVLGTGATAKRFVDALVRHRIYGYVVVGMAGSREEAGREYEPYFSGSVLEYKKTAVTCKADMIVHTLGHREVSISDVLEYCDSEGLDCRIIPDWADFITHQARVDAIDNIPVFAIRDIPLRNGYNRFLKRSMDIVLSSITLILISPLMLLLAIIVRLNSPGPVFFVQERIGLDRRVFRMLKFRSMKIQSAKDSDMTWGSKNDQRVTSVGRILRKTSLDELPQLINVLFGNMSIVGPRPERPHFVNEYKTRYSHYMRRHAVKAGITGWAQIEGFRGDTSIAKRINADIYYIENWSIWLDLLIILRTIPSMLRNPGE